MCQKLFIRNTAQPPWFDSEVRHAINKKKTAWRKARKNNSKKHWADFRRVKSKLKSVIKSKYNSYITSLGSVCKTNPKRFWSFVNSKTKSKTSPSCVSNSGEDIIEPKQRATCFNVYFYSVFNSDTSSPPPQVPRKWRRAYFCLLSGKYYPC